MTNLTLEEKKELIRMALAAREKAYVPYSDFMVGAALRAKANEELAAMAKAETTDALNKVLFELSSGMKNAYSRSDA